MLHPGQDPAALCPVASHNFRRLFEQCALSFFVASCASRSLVGLSEDQSLPVAGLVYVSGSAAVQELSPRVKSVGVAVLVILSGDVSPERLG